MPIVWTYSVIALTFPFWPLYFDSIGLTESQISLLIGVGPLAGILVFQYWGYLSDTVLNIRMCILLMSLATAVISAIFPYFRSFYALLVLMALFAVFSNARVGMTTALVLQNKDGERQYGPMRTLGSVAFIIIVFLVAPLTDPATGMGEAIIFPLLVVVNLLCAVSVLTIKDRPMGTQMMDRSKRPTFMQVQRILLASPVMRMFLLYLAVSQVPHNISHHFVILFVRDDLGGSNAQATATVNIGAVMEILIFLTFGRLLANVRLMPLFFFAVASQVVRWGMIYLYPSLFSVFVSSALHMFTYGLMHMCSVILVNRELPEEFRASGQTMLNLIHMSVTMTIGPLMAAAFFQFASLRAWFGFSAAMAAVSLFFWIAMNRRYCEKHGVSGFWAR